MSARQGYIGWVCPQCSIVFSPRWEFCPSCVLRALRCRDCHNLYFPSDGESPHCPHRKDEDED